MFYLKDLLAQNGKRSAMFLAFMLVTMIMFAVPAKPGLKRLLTLTDGTTVTAMLVGDEYAHYWIGEDGQAYQSVGNDVYQRVDATEVNKRASARRSAANQRRTRRMAPHKVGNVGSITGAKKGIIILVNFQDVSFTATRSDFDSLANTPSYNSGKYKGSMYDYFYAQSDGQFELTFDVVGPYTVSKNCSYYGSNNSNGDDKHPAEMVIEALQLADPDVDYSNYDWDNDGEVDQVYVVYAGKGEADGGAATTIWPHEFTLSSAKYYSDGTGRQTLDGVKIDTYACGGEQNGSTGETAGIGTMCHEFSHCLGYPDFYDIDYSGGQGMFEWDLMDSGSYNDDGYQPAGFTSYERWVAGWKDPIELLNTQSITDMAALQDEGSKSYVIYNKGNRDEYYLLENRQKTGWDASLPGKGLLIIHVDYDSLVWSINQPNDTPSHQRMTWVAADNEYQYTMYQGNKYYTKSGAANDPFPYGSVNAFGKNTTPAATLYNANSDGTYYLDSSVENITQNSNGTISFDFRGISNVADPTFSPAGGSYADAQTVTISCETTDATIYYTLDGSTPTTSSTRYTEPLYISDTTTVKAIAVKDKDQSAVVTATYQIGGATSDPNTKKFKLVTSVSEMETGLRYIIACGSKNTAAGDLYDNKYLINVDVTSSSDVITIDNNVAVFIVEQGTDGWIFKNESTNEYLIATEVKKVKCDSTASEWTLSNATGGGVIMTHGSFGTMLYNVSSPRFTTYTSTPSATMIQANLYKEYSDGTTPVTPEPFIIADESLSFETTVGTPKTEQLEILSEDLTEDITLTLTDPDDVFSLSATTIPKTDTDATVDVTFTPTAAGSYTGYITLTSAGAEPVTVSLTATATSNVDPTLEYYVNADGKKGENLKTAMSSIIYTRTEKSYDYLWTAFSTTDVNSNHKIWDMYSNITNYTPVSSGSTYKEEGDCYNREHSFPQSWFGSNTPMKTDLHHIYPTDGFVNGKRANYPFGETSSPTYTSANDFSKLGPCSYLGYTSTVFEPADEYKGDFARTYFYMVTCYEEKLHDWYTNYSNTEVTAVLDGTTYPALTEWQLEMLMKWSKNDPVSEKEVNRNNAVYAIQNNRNPFIDYPGLEEYVWGFMKNSSFSYDNYVRPVYNDLYDVTMSFDPETVEATLGEYFTEPTLTITPEGLTVTYSSSDETVATVDEQTGEVTLVAEGTTTITATFAGNDSYNESSASYTLTVSSSEQLVGTGNYALVTDASTLKAGDKILIVEQDLGYVLSTRQNANNRSATDDFTSNPDGTLTPGETAQIITLEKFSGNFLFNVGDDDESAYLYAAHSDNNWLRTKSVADDNAQAAIYIDEGVATITFQGTNTRNVIRFNPNNNSPIFSCYISTTGTLPMIYREVMVPAVKAVTLNDDGSGNSDVITDNDGKTVDVTLAGRTFYKDGSWNTICVPFSITDEQLADPEHPFYGADILQLKEAFISGSTLTLNFIQPEGGISAGVPYIIKWEAASEDIVEPEFSGVTINSDIIGYNNGVEGDLRVRFLGTYGAITISSEDKSILCMGANNSLYYPNGNGSTFINAFRAYFKIGGDDASQNVPQLTAFDINYGDGTIDTGIRITDYTGYTDADVWYDLSGRKVVKDKLPKGIYIHNGRKVVVK